MKSLWVDKYRPRSIEDYIFTNNDNKDKVKEWVENKSIPHLLLSGPPGTGKTSLAFVMMNELGVDDADFLKINASAKNGIDNVRDTIINFSSLMPIGDYKYILLDESDHLSAAAQAALRGVIDENSETTRFILTANYPHKIIDPIHSRYQSIRIDRLDQDQFLLKMAEILIEEGIEIDPEVLSVHVSSTYPDMRKCINNCQRYTINNVLILPTKEESDTSEYKIEAVRLFNQGQFKEARELICQKINYEEYEEFFKFMYTNTKFWDEGDYAKTQKVIRAIREGIVGDSVVADREINLSATLVTLEMIKDGIL